MLGAINGGVINMPNYPFVQVDAFTDRALGGNPCVILFDTDDMDAPTMQAIAQEMNLPETSFVRSSSVADFGARYFTPAKEIPLAGHPTIATTHALIETGCLLLTGDTTSFTVELPVGPIKNGSSCSRRASETHYDESDGAYIPRIIRTSRGHACFWTYGSRSAPGCGHPDSEHWNSAIDDP